MADAGTEVLCSALSRVEELTSKCNLATTATKQKKAQYDALSSFIRSPKVVKATGKRAFGAVVYVVKLLYSCIVAG